MQTEKVGQHDPYDAFLTDRHMLRCDRDDPCSSCKIREISCTYTTNSQPKPAPRERKLVNDSLERVRRLEKLVSSLASDAKSTDSDLDTKTKISTESIANLGRANVLAGNTNKPEDLAITNTLGKIQVNGDQTIYVSAAHWATIRDEVNTRLTAALIKLTLANDALLRYAVSGKVSEMRSLTLPKTMHQTELSKVLYC